MSEYCLVTKAGEFVCDALDVTISKNTNKASFCAFFAPSPHYLPLRLRNNQDGKTHTINLLGQHAENGFMRWEAEVVELSQL